MGINVLAISHFHTGLRVYEDYCNSIKANSENYYYIDYIDLYTRLGRKAFEIYIETLVVEKKFDYIFFIVWSGDLTFDIYFIEKLSKLSCIVMNFFDTEHFFESCDRYYAQVADLVLLPDYLSKYRYEILNINTLCTFSLFDSKYYRPLEEMNKNIDVSFVGNIAINKRREYIDYLINNGISVECYGANTKNGFISFDKMIEIFNKTKINLNFTRKCDEDWTILGLGSKINNRIKQVKGRPIEIALCRGFVLTENAPGIENMFEIEKEIGIFHTKEELLEKVKYYLKNEKEREDMAIRGYEKAFKNYDAKTAFAKIFSIIDRYKRRDLDIYLDNDFIKNYTAYRFFYIGQFIFNRKLKNLVEEFCILFKYREINYYKAYRYFRDQVSLSLDRYPRLKNILKKFKQKIRKDKYDKMSYL